MDTLPVPVVVVGNLTVGGTGKTPCTLALTAALRELGWHPGIISRGYGGYQRVPAAVLPASDPAQLGDEPVLMAGRNLAPVWVGRRRVQVAQALLRAHPEVDVLLSDDGLQHRALPRQVECVVVDGARGWGNGALLPAGPLRESLSRLATVDAVVVNCASETPPMSLFSGMAGSVMSLESSSWISLQDPNQTLPRDHFYGQSCLVLAGIGHPERFFGQLERWGIVVERRPFPDHHPYRREDLPAHLDKPVLMTEKDAIKWRRLGLTQGWYLPVDAHLEPALIQRVDTLLRTKDSHG